MNETETCKVRTPYHLRSTWMAEKHRQYGSKCHVQDIDNLNDMWLEHTSGELAALCEWKQDYEEIYLYKYKAMETLANNSKIPFFIVVGYQEFMSYYVIPFNSYAKAIPSLENPRFLSERNYIKLLHYIRKTNASPEILEGKSIKLPPEGTPLPNIK